MSDEHEQLLKQVVDLELRMFLALEPAIPSACQEQPETFKLMRKGGHHVLSAATLKSYLADLEEAVEENRNLMALKYARIDNLIPPLSENPLIDRIVEIEGRWLTELAGRFPLTFKGKSDYAAGVYLRSELETYSPVTLESYYDDLSRALDEGRNLTEKRYTYVFRETGYDSIAEVEKERAGTG